MELEVYPVGPFAMNFHLVYDQDTRQAILIDPGDELDLIRNRIRELELSVSHILLTHGHIDHVYWVEELHQELKVPMWMHRDDWEMTKLVQRQAMMFGLPPGPVPLIDGDLPEQDELVLGPFRFQVIHTPGHSPGSVTFVSHANRFAIVGDTVFNGSIGRTDLPGGNHRQLISVIKNKILTLPGDYTLYPGHGPSTTVAAELKHNPFLSEVVY